MNIVSPLIQTYKPELRTTLKVFLWGIIIGALYGALIIKTPQGFMDLLAPIFEDITSQTSPTDPKFMPLYLALLKRNLTATMLIVALGMLHRFIPLGIILLNGALMGIVLIFLASMGRLIDAVLLIPHGIFELPALFLASAYGISLTTKSEKKGISGRYQTLIKQKRLLVYIVLLLIIAGAIEAGAIVLATP